MVQLDKWIIFFWSLFILILTIFSFLRLYLIRWWEKHEEVIDPSFNPKVHVIVPCKGIDLNMEDNLKSILSQSYKNFSLVAVVDSENDPSFDLLKKLHIDTLKTDMSYSGSGKVRAISTALKDIPDEDIVILVDSDTMVSENWILYLINPLKKPSTGAVSTYPFYIPVDNKNFWGMVKKIWGYLGINMMEFRPARFVWGGSVAFRRSLIGENDFKLFSQAVSDDATITAICKRKNLAIEYSKKATPKVLVKEDKYSFMEWSNRQMAISLSYAKSAFHVGILMYGLVIMYIIALIPLTLFVWWGFILGYIPYLFSIGVNVNRDRKHIARTVIITIIMPFIFILNMINGNKMSHIEWRGEKYALR
ncbi:glycosyltransferase [Cuniculiplasma sp. SKW4]|uniref:glycosyltransferase n=1 Tax=Cuniculiplasma sp. SKW4 TaxID=3400171 RepID=UPI003FD359A7